MPRTFLGVPTLTWVVVVLTALLAGVAAPIIALFV